MKDERKVSAAARVGYVYGQFRIFFMNLNEICLNVANATENGGNAPASRALLW